MTNKSNNNFQYNSCISKGICSVNPRTYSLQAVLILFLKIIAKYSIKLYKKDVIQDFAKTMFLNIISVVVTNPEFTEESYKACINKLKEFFPKIIEKYKECYPEDKNVDNELNSMDIFKYSNDVLESIKFGDKTLKDFENHVPVAVRDMYKIMLVVSKSISINLLYLETFGKNYEEAYITVLKFYDFINKDTTDIQLLKKEIISAAEIDRKLANILKDAQIELYGKQRRTNVSYSTRAGKVVLVLGSNIKELENILEALKDYEIDVYTHDNMMLAHTFPKFSQYERLRGQYGKGIENCLLDFATFPGVIILTKNSLHNIENLYRGRLFTTDETIPNGVLQIKNNDFSEVIKSALNAKGFKTGKTCESEAIGYDIDKLIAHIKSKIDNKNYSHIFFIGADKDSADEKEYFEKLMKLAGNKVLFLSFFYNFKNPNCVNINACFERYCMVDIFDRLKNTKIPISVFYPKCDKNTISQMVYFYNNNCNNVFVGTCTPIILNPTLIKALSTVFKVHSMTTPKKDFNFIMKQSE